MARAKGVLGVRGGSHSALGLTTLLLITVRVSESLFTSQTHVPELLPAEPRHAWAEAPYYLCQPKKSLGLNLTEAKCPRVPYPLLNGHVVCTDRARCFASTVACPIKSTTRGRPDLRQNYRNHPHTYVFLLGFAFSGTSAVHFMLGTSPYISTLVKPGIMGPHKEGWYQKFPRGTVPRSVCHFLSAALASCIGGGLMSVCATEGREGRGGATAQLYANISFRRSALPLGFPLRALVHLTHRCFLPMPVTSNLIHQRMKWMSRVDAHHKSAAKDTAARLKIKSSQIPWRALDYSYHFYWNLSRWELARSHNT